MTNKKAGFKPAFLFETSIHRMPQAISDKYYGRKLGSSNCELAYGSFNHTLHGNL